MALEDKGEEFANGFTELLVRLADLPQSEEKDEVTRGVAEALVNATLEGGPNAVEKLLKELRSKLDQLREKNPIQ